MNLSKYSVNENEGCIPVCASVVNGILERSVYLIMSTTDDSATSVDYSALSAELQFNETTSTACMDVCITDDDRVENFENFKVGINSNDPDVDYTTQSSTVTITDDDMAMIGFVMEVYEAKEGQTVKVCATVCSTLERSILVNITTEDLSTEGLMYHSCSHVFCLHDSSL